ncbi:putative disease resistance protein RGA1 [Beta vulgaris subsp. vulgaris]|uniref:putative disease resistance protein RGA1 n=1 Tax=Beta vulgaris subsp. vulgaris TaxID=3555 RepID=UPI002036FDCF|nr:putative disease resistance protein RGA1 [Beta vulgaris subsp. vulgaris]
MADIGTVLTVAQTLFAALECSSLKEIFFVWGYKSDLEDLKLTVSTITKVLLDSEAKLEFSNEEEDWIEKLQQAVYDADDLFDEILTFAKQKEQNTGGIGIGKLFKKVRDFLSSNNQFTVAYTISQQVKKIRKKLDAFADNHRKFGFVVVESCSRPIRRRAESYSYAYVADVIGREDDLNVVIHMLLDSDVKDDVGFLTIVGVGGLGKTTLAQLVYHDERVICEFSLRLWVCVSDQDGEQFDVRTILAKILESATSKKHDSLGIDILQSQLQQELGNNKYLLVLDDVWNEDRYRWLDLRKFLITGARGSKVIVTSRSKMTASIIGSEHSTYELECLSEVNSWRLFEMTAFGMGDYQDFPSVLVEIGKKIVENCHNSPLAIKVVGSLLYGQDLNKWKSFQESGLAKIRKGENEIMSILKLSYHNLESPLKTCFRYCALFPKDHVINKRKLINLWMAQQYIVPFDGGQSIEDAGEEYFSILLRRCFFQDVEKSEFGEVYSCKIHDLMRDVAQDVAGNEMCLVNGLASNLADTNRHLFHAGNICTMGFSKLKIRTYLRDGYNLNQVSTLLASWRLLRVLDLHDLNIEFLPGSIGKLLHLRYLDLSQNRNLRALPTSITNLYNLQILDLHKCFMLRELPNDLNKLVNLRCLLNDDCSWLLCTPPGMGKLSYLHTLSEFIVRGKHYVDQLKDLKALKKLRDSFNISTKCYRYRGT